MTVWGFDQTRASKLKALADHVGYASSAGARSPVALQARWEAWIFLTPAGGIPAMTGTTPGVATCSSFFINGAQNLDVTRADPSSMLRNVDRPVYNISPNAIPGDTYVIAVDVSGVPVAISTGDIDICKAICECDTFAQSEECINCCGRCDFEPDAIENFSATVNGVSWSQTGPSVYSGADKCEFDVPVEDTSSNAATAYLQLQGAQVTWVIGLTELGSAFGAGSDPAVDPCNGTQTFDNLIDANGQFEPTGTLIPACSCCGITYAPNNQIGCKFPADPISNFSGTSFASGQPITQVGPSVQRTPCSWDITDNETTIWQISMDGDGYFRATENNGLVYGGAQNRVDQQACTGTVILSDTGAGSQQVQFTSTANEEGCNPFTPAAMSTALRQVAPELFPPGGCQGCQDAANLLDAYGPDVSEDHLSRIVGEFVRVSKQPEKHVREQIGKVITRAQQEIK